MPAEVATTACPQHHQPTAPLSSFVPLELNKESTRLATFSGWPKSEWISPEELARHGFHYTGRGDIVKCYFCQIELADWQPDDEVNSEHRRWSEYCPLMMGRPTNNEAIPGSLREPVARPVFDTVGGGRRSYCRQHSITGRVTTAGTNSSQPSARSSAVNQTKPRYPEFMLHSERLATFKDWPTAITQRPAQLVDAGFFYTGKSDAVMCFSCGGNLRGWERTDDPWEEHAKHYGNCQYLNLLKGPEFVTRCQRQEPPVDEPRESSSLKNTNSSSESNVSLSATKQGTPEGASDSDQDSERKLCKICYENEYNTVFIPCMHVVACARCASSVVKCPVCNEKYTAVHRVYLQ